MKAYRHGEMILIPVPKNLQDQWQNLFKQAGRKMDEPRVIAEGETMQRLQVQRLRVT